MTETLFAEVVETARNASFDAMTSAELSAWVSSALGLWREPGVATDPADDDLAFVEWLAQRRDPTTDRLLAALGAVAAGRAGRRAAELIAPLADPDPTGAWALSTHGGEVIVLSFDHGDGTELLLVDIDGDGAIADIQFAADADADAVMGSGDHTVAVPEARTPAQAAARLAGAWQQRLESPVPPTDAHLANQAVLRARLAMLGHDLGEPRWPAPVPLPAVDALADAASIATLRSAIGDIVAAVAPPGAEAMVEPVARLVRWTEAVGRPVSELEALATLEWADWLGATIGLCRSGAGSMATGSALVDHVNRVPEVTSTIPARDRDWFAWAFSVAIETWAELGVVDAEHRLTDAGRWALPQALLAAWSPPPAAADVHPSTG